MNLLHKFEHREYEYIDSYQELRQILDKPNIRIEYDDGLRVILGNVFFEIFHYDGLYLSSQLYITPWNHWNRWLNHPKLEKPDWKKEGF